MLSGHVELCYASRHLWCLPLRFLQRPHCGGLRLARLSLVQVETVRGGLLSWLGGLRQGVGVGGDLSDDV